MINIRMRPSPTAVGLKISRLPATALVPDTAAAAVVVVDFKTVPHSPCFEHRRMIMRIRTRQVFYHAHAADHRMHVNIHNISATDNDTRSPAMQIGKSVKSGIDPQRTSEPLSYVLLTEQVHVASNAMHIF